MKKLITNRIFLLFALILILVFKLEIVFDSFLLLFFFCKLFFTDYSIAVGQITFNLFDYLLSALLIILLPVVIIIKRNSFFFLNSGISFTSFTVILLLICYIFAPLITSSNPEFQKNISVTKLLPPLSSVNEIYSLKNSNESGNYFILKQKVIK